MRWTRAIPGILLLLAAACRSTPGYLPVPAQRPVADGRDPGFVGSFIRMDDGFADTYIVGGITSEKVAWRWTFVRPEVRLRVQETANLKFVMEFAVPEVTFRDTGPVVVSCYVNEHPLGSMRCLKAGKYTFEKPVPADWVRPGIDVIVRAEIDKHWLSKSDGARLGFLLGAIGFPAAK